MLFKSVTKLVTWKFKRYKNYFYKCFPSTCNIRLCDIFDSVLFVLYIAKITTKCYLHLKMLIIVNLIMLILKAEIM